MSEPARLRRGAWIALSIAGFGVLAPIVLVAFGADYLAPRNLVGAAIPLSVLIAILLVALDASLGALLAATILAAFAIVTVDVDLSPRLQRGNWRGVARALGPGARPRAITTVELGAAPLEYYLGHLRNLAREQSVSVSEIDETGYAPLRHGAGRAPAPGFRLLERRNVDGLIVYRFVSSVPRLVSEAELRRHVITLAHPEVLVSTGDRGSAPATSSAAFRPRMSSSDENI